MAVVEAVGRRSRIAVVEEVVAVVLRSRIAVVVAAVAVVVLRSRIVEAEVAEEDRLCAYVPIRDARGVLCQFRDQECTYRGNVPICLTLESRQVACPVFRQSRLVRRSVH